MWKKGSTNNVNNRDCIQEINFFCSFFRFDDVRGSFIILLLALFGIKSSQYIERSFQSVRSMALARSSPIHNRNPLLRIPLSIVRCSCFHGQRHRTTVSWPNSFAHRTNCKLQVCNFHPRGFSSTILVFWWVLVKCVQNDLWEKLCVAMKC